VRLAKKLPEEANRKWPIGNRMTGSGSVSANSSKPIKDTDFNFDKRVSGGSPKSGHDSLKFMEKGRGQGYVTQIFLKSLGGGMHSCELLL